MSIFRLLIIGCGELGSRHLQGVMQLRLPAEVWVVDPAPEALERAEKRAAELPANENIRAVNYSASLAELSGDFELAVIATNADIRRQVLSELLEGHPVKYLLLEKFLFQKLDDYDFVAELLSQKYITAWVNCVRRTWPVYRKIREELSTASKLQLLVSGGNWRLSSNAIHFLDLFAFLHGSNELQIERANFSTEIFESKRKGFYEFNGELIITGNNFKGVITSYDNSSAPITIAIHSDAGNFEINESSGELRQLLKSGNWQPESTQFSPFYQSQLTNTIIEEILKTGECSLPDFQSSAALHTLLLKEFLAHWNRASGKNERSCPIT